MQKASNRFDFIGINAIVSAFSKTEGVFHQFKEKSKKVKN